jgi:hypothetical protein
MLIGLVRYILAPERLQGPVFPALPGCRATALPLKREVAPTLVVARLIPGVSRDLHTEVQLVCFGPCFLQGSQLFLAMPPQQLKISGKHVSLHLPSLGEHIHVFIIIFRPKLQELCGVEVAPPVDRGQYILSPPLNTYSGPKDNTTQALAISRVYSQ